MEFLVKTPTCKIGRGNSRAKLYGDWDGYVYIETYRQVNDSIKRMIKELLLNATGPFVKDTNPRFNLVISCYVGADFVDFHSLSKEIKEQILDDILFKNRTKGQFVEHGKIVRNQENGSSISGAST